ncbi:bile acid:sodium symporter [Halalkalicoccus jeotgali]|uniref:bile acid:sodium symporter n=1 Tax=Halalkalicoccus jeotgali TaxID=413810 RepID=UPI000A4CCDF2|nr:bile acid:sodium symporter [Halalkalicoccus jeotgali]
MNRPWNRYVARARRFENVWLVLGAVALGVLVPGPGEYADVLVTPLVVFLIYGSLRGIEVATVEYRSYGLVICCSLVVSYVLLPFGGIRVAGAFLTGDALLGMAIVLAAPTTAGSAIIWTRLAGGDSEVAALVSISSLAVAPLVTPVVLSSLLDRRVAVPAETMVIDLLVIVLGGVALAVVLPDRLISDVAVDRASGLAILCLIYSSIASVDIGAIDPTGLAVVMALVVSLLGAGFVLVRSVGVRMGIDRSTYLPLFFTAGLKNLGIALLIAFAYRSVMVVVVIVTYYVLQQLVGALIADLA